MIEAIEIWKDIPGYEGLYQVSNKGRVRSLGVIYPNRLTKGTSNKPGRILNPWSERGYPRVALVTKGKHKFISVHQLVAMVFIPRVEGKLHINHKDGDPLNNLPENLEWCTPKENVHHAKYVLKRIGYNRKKVRDTITGKVYQSIKDAHDELCFSHSKEYTVMMLNGRAKNKTSLQII